MRRKPVVKGCKSLLSRKSAQAFPKLPSGKERNYSISTIWGTFLPLDSEKLSIRLKKVLSFGLLTTDLSSINMMNSDCFICFDIYHHKKQTPIYTWGESH